MLALQAVGASAGNVSPYLSIFTNIEESLSSTTFSSLVLSLVAVRSFGQGVCLNNIIAACAVVGLTSAGIEGQILMRTYKYVLASTTIATVVMLVFFFRF
jgi:L-lactate permease